MNIARTLAVNTSQYRAAIRTLASLETPISEAQPLLLARNRLLGLRRQFSNSRFEMAPTTKQFDYIVIGGGSGGSGAARRASGWYKAKTCIIDSGTSGGCCVNVG